MQHISKTTRILFLIIFASLLLTACGAKKMSGAFVGVAKADLRLVSSSSDYPETLTDSGYDVLATVLQDGDALTLRFSNTPLLKNCELKAKVENTSFDIASGAICETDIAGMSRTINISSGEIYISNSANSEAKIKVYGFSGRSLDGDAFFLNFEGKSAK
jgi:hypothetical protein